MAYSLGVDLGTTFTSAAIVDEAGVRMVSLSHDGIAIPSVLAKTTDGFAVGVEALSVAAGSPWTVAREFKRRFGDPTPMLVAGGSYSPPDLMSELLSWVLTQVSTMEGAPPDQVALTHPASWGAYKLDLLRGVAKQAGVDDAQLVSEPEAAAIHYHERNRVADGTVIAVYDLGGGTFDATILGRSGDSYQLQGRPIGLDQLGGLDFDDIIFRYVTTTVGKDFDSLDHEDPEAQRAVARLREECVRAKIALSYDTKAIIPVVLPGLFTEILLQRREFEIECLPLIERTVLAMLDVTASAGLTPEELDSILLVGGSSRIPLISQRLSASLGVKVALDTHPKHAVALGAALASVASQSRSSHTDGPPADVGPRKIPPIPGQEVSTIGSQTVEVQQLPEMTVSFDPSSIRGLLDQRFAVILNGPRAGDSIQLTEGTTIFGRTLGTDLVGLGNPLTSRRHLSLTLGGGQVQALDLGSTNGSSLDGHPLGKQKVDAQLGSILDLAGTLLMLDGPASNPGSVAALTDSWLLPDPPTLRNRFFRRDRSAEWLIECEEHIHQLTDLRPLVERAARFEYPSAGLLRFWSDQFPERAVAKDPTDPSFGSVVVGYHDRPSLLRTEVPEHTPGSARSRLTKLMAPHQFHTLIPLQLPINEGVTIIVASGSTGDDLLRSMIHQVQHHHVRLPFRVFGMDSAQPPHPADQEMTNNNGVALIRSAGLKSSNADAAMRAAQGSAGVVWLVSELNPASHWDHLITISSVGATLMEAQDSNPMRFIPATLAEAHPVTVKE